MHEFNRLAHSPIHTKQEWEDSKPSIGSVVLTRINKQFSGKQIRSKDCDDAEPAATDEEKESAEPEVEVENAVVIVDEEPTVVELSALP